MLVYFCLDMKLKEDVKKNAFAKFEQSHKAAKSGHMERPSERLESKLHMSVHTVFINVKSMMYACFLFFTFHHFLSFWTMNIFSHGTLERCVEHICYYKTSSMVWKQFTFTVCFVLLIQTCSAGGLLFALMTSCGLCCCLLINKLHPGIHSSAQCQGVHIYIIIK